MARRPEIGNVQLYPDRPLSADDKNGYVLKFFCPLRKTRIRRNCGTRDRREARRILRECRERLLNGEYLASGGSITVSMQQASVRSDVSQVLTAGSSSLRTWQQCFDDYYRHRKQRGRAKSLTDASSRIEIAGRILDAEREARGLPSDGPIQEYVTLSLLEYLQERLLEGAEGLYETRAPMSVNTMLAAVMAFLRFCKRHGWIESVPELDKLDVEEVMKGRPITVEEFERFLAAVPEVVGERPAASWKFVLQILWESAFRVGDVMNFSWDDDERRIHPAWPKQQGRYATLLIPSKQKNKKAQEIPMLPGLEMLLKKISKTDQHGWVVNPLALNNQERLSSAWFQPNRNDLHALVQEHSNSAIARACGVTETAVRKWLRKANICRNDEAVGTQGDVPDQVVAKVRDRAEEIFRLPAPSSGRRLTTEFVGRVLSDIGKKAGIVVQQADKETGRRIKYASAHDLRRGCALRLIDAGVSAETLKLVLRHEDFKTTERFYGAVRSAQAAAAEIHRMLVNPSKKIELVGGLMGGTEKVPHLNAAEMQKLKALLNSL